MIRSPKNPSISTLTRAPEPIGAAARLRCTTASARSPGVTFRLVTRPTVAPSMLTFEPLWSPPASAMITRTVYPWELWLWMSR
jgi:hypothetical protein